LQKERNDLTFLAEFDLKKTLFQGQLKKITKSSRNLMLIFNVIKRYFDLKSKANQLKDLAEKNKIVPRIVFVGGISRPGDKLHLMQIKFLINVSNMLENDQDTRPYLRLIFLPNYSTSKEYLYVPSLDVNEQLTIPGK
jgi:starch phosphorylase